jgi:hypothetical protein
MPPSGGSRTSLSVSYGPSPYNVSTSVMGPGVPQMPITPDQVVRLMDYPVNVNSNIRPRAFEPFGFPALKAFANVELVRLAIETRKDQFERLDWQIKPIDEKAGKKDQSAAGRIKTLTKFWRKPNGVDDFATWQRELIESLLVMDAPAIERLRTRGGQLIGLDVVPGETIHPMVDETGRRPRGPTDVAYQQVIKGIAWADLTNADLIYAPRNRRPNHLYGFGPVEQIIVTINTIIRRQGRQLAYFTDGNIPAGLLNGPDGWNPDQVQDMQTWMDAKMSGQTDEQMKLLWVPAGTKYTAFKDSPLKDDFDEWLARIVAYAFSLPPTPFIKQMNRSTGQTDQDRGLEEGLEPLKLWFKRLADGVIQDDLGHDDMEFAWVDTPSIDPAIQSQIDDRNLKNGSTTLDEVRDGRGQDPLPDGLGAKPFIYTSTGGVTLEQVWNASDNALNPPEPPTAVAELPGAAKPVSGAAAPKAAPKPTAPPKAEKLAKAGSLITADRPKARRAAVSLRKAVSPILQKAGDEVAAEVGRKLRGLGKAADDTGGLMNAALAAKLAKEADLRALDAIASASFDDLFEIASDSTELALASVGVKAEGDLVDQVHQRAVDYAKRRGAELVSLDGDKNIVDATRAAIQTAIFEGLEANIGADAIADSIQASTAFSAYRAELIADTEIAFANADGKLAGWNAAADTGLTLTHSWQTSNDGDCCDECQGNEDQGAIPIDEAFESGDDAEPAHPNCKCVTYAEVVDEESDKAARTELRKAQAPQPITITVPVTVNTGKGSFERTVVTKYDADGRIAEFERHTVEE